MKSLLPISLAVLLLGSPQDAPPRRSGLDLSAFDRSVRPQDDLFRFANGTWLRTTTIPADRVTAGAFFELSDKVDEDLRRLIDAIPPDSPPGSPSRKVRDLYDSIVDEAQLNARGWTPIRPQLERIAAVRSVPELAAEAGALSAAATGGPFAASLAADAQDPRRIVVHVSQGGILLPDPTYYADPDDAVNYGAIGALMAHEVSHAFDTRGRTVNADGRPDDWWTTEDEQAFSRQALLLAAQYGTFSPLEGVRVNGTLTLAENVGDLAGLSSAHRAYRRSLGGREAPVIDGFTGDQRFLLGWAQVWRTALRDEYLRQWVLWNQYAPPEYRANGPANHVDAFYTAFGVQPSDRMFRLPETRASIW